MEKVAVGYVRVSTERQAEEGLSLDDQKNQITKLCATKGIKLLRFYEEPGETATEDTRPELRRLMDDASSPERPFDFVAIYASHRLFRDNLNRAMYERRLEELGISVLSATQSFEGTDAQVSFLKNIMGSVDEFYSRQNAENTIRCMMENARRGFINGGRTPYGFQTVATAQRSRTGFKKKLAIVPNEADIVRRIYVMAVHGHEGQVVGTKAIATWLNEQGHRCRGRKWTKQQVHSVLRSATYDGRQATFVWDSRKGKPRPPEEHIYVDVPRLIERELWEQAQQTLAARTIDRVEAKADQAGSLLTGLAVCGLCGAKLHVMTGNSGKYAYYRCSAKTKENVNSCACHNVPKDILDSAVLHAVSHTLLTSAEFVQVVERIRDLAADRRKDVQQELLLLQRQRVSSQEKLDQLYAGIAEGKLSVDGYLKEVLNGHERKLKALTGQIAQLESHRELPLRKFSTDQAIAFAAKGREVLSLPDNPLVRSYLRAVVSRVEVRADTFTVTSGRFQLAAAVSRWDGKNASGSVPSFVSKWRPEQESNL